MIWQSISLQKFFRSTHGLMSYLTYKFYNIVLIFKWVWDIKMASFAIQSFFNMFNSVWSSDAIWRHRPGLNIRSGNGLLSGVTNTLPAPMLSKYQRGLVVFPWLQIYRKCPRYLYLIGTETKMSSFWRNFNHWLHWKLSFWQLPVQPVMKISSKCRHFRFSVISLRCHR